MYSRGELPRISYTVAYENNLSFGQTLLIIMTIFHVTAGVTVVFIQFLSVTAFCMRQVFPVHYTVEPFITNIHLYV